jgi:hypothetical protein
VATHLRALHIPVRDVPDATALQRVFVGHGVHSVVVIEGSVEASILSQVFELGASVLVLTSSADALDTSLLSTRGDFVRLSGRLEAGAPDQDVLHEVALRVRKLLDTRPARKRLLVRLGEKLGLARRTGDEGWHDPENGRLDAARIARAMGIPLATLASAIGQKYDTVHKTPASPNLQRALEPFARTMELLLKFHDSRERMREWLNTPHRELAERAPLRVMLEGHADLVRNMLEAAYQGIPT